MTEIHIEPPTPTNHYSTKANVDHFARSDANGTDANGTDTPHLTPRNRSPQPSIRSDAEPPELDWYDDNDHDEFEWIKLPKQRDFDVFRVPRHSPEKRNTANVPLIAKRHDGKDVVMWAKMDTGADANIINASTLVALLGDQAKTLLRPLTMQNEEFHILGDNRIEVTQYVNLSFQAGRSKRQFDKVRFMVVADQPEKSAKDGVPNVILGLETLQEHSMIMIDLDYHVEAELGLEVIAERAEHEAATIRTIGPIKKYPQTPGVVRK